MESLAKPKKRGRKPRGGLVVSAGPQKAAPLKIPNIIIQLKCQLSDIKQFDDIGDTQLMYSPDVVDIVGVEDSSLLFQELGGDIKKYQSGPSEGGDKGATASNTKLNNPDESAVLPDADDTHMRHTELGKICFFCGCGGRPTNISIPISPTASYGQFCRPECAAAFNLKHAPDTSTKYERNQLINILYGKNGESITPAPSPYFLLHHYSGDMSPTEYHDMIGSCDISESVDIIRIFPKVVREEMVEDKAPQSIGKYHVKRANSFFNQK
jgi:hypothetical protein